MFHGASQTYLWAEFSQRANNEEPLKERYRAHFSFPPVMVITCYGFSYLPNTLTEAEEITAYTTNGF